MRIGITGDRGDLCLRLIAHLEDRFGEIDKISLFGDAWKSRTFDYDVLVHIAGVIPKPGVTTEQYYAINRDLSAEVAEKAYADGTKHVVVFSTMAVYGMEPSMSRKGGIVDEKTVCHPNSDYGKSKLAGEEAFRALECDSFKVSYLRIPSVYYEGNTLFMNVAREMYQKFPKFYPKLGASLGRNTIYAGNVCECVALIIERGQDGIVCPQDMPVYSLFDYMNLINEANGGAKKPSRLLGLFVRMIMLIKPEWKTIFGQIKYDTALADVFGGDYRIYDQTESLKKSME